MSNFYKWCADKENLKILVMLGLAVLLVFVLKHRFSGKGDIAQPAPAKAEHDRGRETRTGGVQQQADAGNQLKASEDLTGAETGLREAPPFLTRDIFSRVSISGSPAGEAAETEDDSLELKATITDGRDPLAIIGDEVLGIGDLVKGSEVISIRNNEVVLAKGGVQYVLRMVAE